MDIDKLRQIHRLLYQTPTTRRIINSKTGEVFKNNLEYDLCCGLEKINSFNKYNVYVEKYHDLTRIRTIILDFDGDNAYQDVYKASKLLQDYDIMNLVVNSTNKGYHLYIILPKPLNLLLTPNKSMNNEVFIKFIINLIGDYKSLDKVNYGLYSNIRLVGSVHPKTGEVLRIEYAFAPFLDENTLKINPNYYMDKNEYFYNSFINSLSYLNKMEKMNNIIKSRSKYSNFGKAVVDLRQYFDGKSFDGGRSKWCVCPFHDDKHASLHVYEKIAICEVCGRIDFEDIKKHFNIGV